MKEIDAIEFVKYSKTEEILNSVTHIFGAVLTFIATIMCVIRSISLERTDYLVIGLVYCFSMLIVFVCSSVYHGLPLCRAKKVMRMIDYTAIYLMIMGTITPYMLLSVAFNVALLDLKLTTDKDLLLYNIDEETYEYACVLSGGSEKNVTREIVCDVYLESDLSNAFYT